MVAQYRSRFLAWRDPFANRRPSIHIRISKVYYSVKIEKPHARCEASEKLSDVSVVLGLVNHLAQPTNIEPPPLVVLYHIIKVIQCPVGTLLNPLAIELASGNLAIARLGGPIAPSLESKIVLAVQAAIALLLGFAWTHPDRPSTYSCTQGGKGSRAVGEVDEAVAWVSRADGVDRDVDIF